MAMVYEHAIARYRNLYAKLLRLYPKPYRERFGEGMEQTFNDLLRERAETGGGLLGFVLWVFVETSAGIFRENITTITMKNKRLIGILLAVAFILLVPLVAMQFTNEVNWTLSDFVFMGALLLGTGLMFELAARQTGNITYRAAAGLAVVTALLLTWVNLAVGIIGDDNPANLMYFGVVAVGLIGAAVARLEPRGMARTLFAMALAQALTPAIALIIWNPQVNSWAPGVLDVFVLNAFFVMLFLGSAWLFRRAARERN